MKAALIIAGAAYVAAGVGTQLWRKRRFQDRGESVRFSVGDVFLWPLVIVNTKKALTPSLPSRAEPPLGSIGEVREFRRQRQPGS